MWQRGARGFSTGASARSVTAVSRKESVWWFWVWWCGRVGQKELWPRAAPPRDKWAINVSYIVRARGLCQRYEAQRGFENSKRAIEWASRPRRATSRAKIRSLDISLCETSFFLIKKKIYRYIFMYFFIWNDKRIVIYVSLLSIGRMSCNSEINVKALSMFSNCIFLVRVFLFCLSFGQMRRIGSSGWNWNPYGNVYID